MQPFAIPVLPAPVNARARARTALVASSDRSFRQRLNQMLSGLRWQVREAEGGAQAWAEVESVAPEALIVDAWLPDLDVSEFLRDFKGRFPEVDLVTADGSMAGESPRGPHRQELLYALRRIQETDTAAWNAAPAARSEGSVADDSGSICQESPNATLFSLAHGKSAAILAAPAASNVVPMSPAFNSAGGITGSQGRHFEERVKEILKAQEPDAVVKQNSDLFALHQWIKNKPVDLIIGNTYCKYISRAENIPFVRFGFPVLDRMGHRYFPCVGYNGALRLMEKMTDAMLDHKDRECADERFELIQ